MRSITRNKTMNRSILVSAMLTAGVVTMPSMAAEFESGEWYGSFDTTVSYGASWRADDIDRNDVGKAANNPQAFVFPTPLEAYRGNQTSLGRWSVNDDDGDLLYANSQDLITHTFKVTAELDIRYKNFGGFFRVSGFHDFENHDKAELSDTAQERVGEDVRLLDAYIWGDHAVGDHFLNWRLGRQVVSWGESTFIQGGLNVINPVDVSKLRLAGSELKEAFEGVNMLYGTIDLTDAVSLEALYLFDFEEIIPDPAGTYFSSSDIATPGATYAMLGFGIYPQPVINPDLYAPVCLGGDFAASDALLPAQLVATGCALSLPRAETRLADDSGQYGLALRWFAENLGGTEFGFYYLKYHSRLPVLSGSAITARPPPFGTASYFTEYPEDRDLYGISFNTTVGTWSLGGEVTYRPNVALQIDDVELLLAALTPLNPLLAAPVARYQSQLGEFGPGEEIKGWHEHTQWQAQATLTKLFGPGNIFRANQIAFVTEFGFNHITDLHKFSDLRYNVSGTDTGGGPDIFTGHFNNPSTEDPDAFADDFSWGYRMLARFDYNNAIGAVTVSPRIAFAHDVDGSTPGPGGSFIDGRKTITIGVGFNYLDKWIFDFAYTDYKGGGRYNLLRNRDFFAASVRYSF
ncbi:MAG: DUF1302 domain-containing protein [Xanthomonadales bacterium]|nr:DUF1302 domain-containing protein [Xanthomonadales bacterium]